MSLLGLVVGVVLQAGLDGGVSVEPCPFDGTPIIQPMELIEELTELRLDLRPVGFNYPPPLARCSKCQYVSGLHWSEEQLPLVRAVVESKAYREQAQHASDYALRALILATLRPDPNEAALEWLRASWETEGTPEWRDTTTSALAAFSRVADLPVPDDESSPPHPPSSFERWRTAQLMRIELLRRLGRFPEAMTVLKTTSKRPPLQRDPYVVLLDTERALIEQKVDAPQPFPSVPVAELYRNDPAFIAARRLNGFRDLEREFSLEQAQLGKILFQRPALHLTVSSRSSRALDSVRWWNFINGRSPRFNWSDLLAAHARAEPLVEQNSWIGEWKNAGSARHVELQLYGLDVLSADGLKRIEPAWAHAGFTGRPAAELILREDTKWCATVFLDRMGGGVITFVSDCGANHWVTERPLFFHTRGAAPYLWVGADGRHERRTTGVSR